MCLETETYPKDSNIGGIAGGGGTETELLHISLIGNFYNVEIIRLVIYFYSCM
jgi:hypothetical protein